MTPLVFKNDQVALSRATYRDIPCVYVAVEGASRGWLMFTSPDHAHWLVAPQGSVTLHELLARMDDFSGELFRGYVNAPYGDRANHKPGIVVSDYHDPANSFCVYPKGKLMKWTVNRQYLVAGTPPAIVPVTAKPKRKDLQKQLKRTQETLDDARSQLHDALALCDERAAEITRVKTEREGTRELAAARLTEVSKLNRNLIDLGAMAQNFKDERDALQRQVDLLSTRIDPAAEGMLRDHRTKLRQALSLLAHELRLLPDAYKPALALATAHKVLEQTA